MRAAVLPVFWEGHEQDFARGWVHMGPGRGPGRWAGEQKAGVAPGSSAVPDSDQDQAEGEPGVPPRPDPFPSRVDVV